MENQENQPEASPRSNMGLGSMVKLFVLGLVGVIVLALLIAVGLGMRGMKKVSQDGLTMFVAKTLNLPVAKINGLRVSYVDYIDDINSLKTFYGLQGTLAQMTDEQVSDQALSRLLVDRVISDLAKEYEVSVDEQEFADTKATIVEQFGDEEKANEEITTRYGWSLEKYLVRVVQPLLLEQALREKFTSEVSGLDEKYLTKEVKARHILFLVNDEDGDAAVKKQAEEVLQKIKDGADFAQMATEYGQDGTKEKGGDLGWFGTGMMVEEFETPVFALEAGQLSPELIKTRYGYHIVQVEETRQAGDFFTFMDDQVLNSKVEILIPIHNPFVSLQEEMATDTVDTETVISETETTPDPTEATVTVAE